MTLKMHLNFYKLEEHIQIWWYFKTLEDSQSVSIYLEIMQFCLNLNYIKFHLSLIL